MATLRNWLIGCYIVEYEQNGSDRAKYGDRLLKRLEERVNTKGLNETLFRNSRNFYKLYPQIRWLFQISATTSHKLAEKIHPMLSDELERSLLGIHPTPSDELIFVLVGMISLENVISEKFSILLAFFRRI